MWRRKQHGRDGEATLTILKSYDAFEALLVEAQLADSMLVALATPWRLTPPIDVATQAARSRQGGDGDNFEVVRRICGAAGGSPARGLDVGGARHAVETHSAH
ncbi:hypothetical protein PF005_g30942 [Phytophthora fragariae]|uniref:Uncharacterized protein n=1 Tax=Phytophthora fragariae TaxID=53985 RepID=A0A6A3V7J1_9STRA|nr:hypothetical protein PF005_g30942 [Phytophthora fragariae]